MKLFIACLLWMVAMEANAADWIVASGLAFHLDRGSYCNKHFTKGVGWERTQITDKGTQVAYSVGAYDNSNCNVSLYAAKAWLPLRSANWRGGWLIGGVTGYGSAVLPVAGLAVSYERGDYGATVTFVPPVSSSPGVLWAQWKFKWK